MKKLILLGFIALFTGSLSAQECNAILFLKEGNVLEYTAYDKKNKATSKATHETISSSLECPARHYKRREIDEGSHHHRQSIAVGVLPSCSAHRNRHHRKESEQHCDLGANPACSGVSTCSFQFDGS